MPRSEPDTRGRPRLLKRLVIAAAVVLLTVWIVLLIRLLLPAG